MKQKVRTILRYILPRKLITLYKFYFVFNKIYGHSNIKNDFIYDGYGRVLPWITYPCIEFLNSLDFSDCRVFEYGAGSSTMYWSKKSLSVTSIEKDKGWYESIKNRVPKNSNVSLASSDKEYIDHINQFEEKFDIIIIDGAVRYPCAEAALHKITKQGIIILDNTEWYPETANLLVENGYTQIDFSGFPPINAFPSCTSIFYKKNDLINKKLKRPQWAPLGGRYLNAYDDMKFDMIEKKFILE